MINKEANELNFSYTYDHINISYINIILWSRFTYEFFLKGGGEGEFFLFGEGDRISSECLRLMG